MSRPLPVSSRGASAASVCVFAQPQCPAGGRGRLLAAVGAARVETSRARGGRCVTDRWGAAEGSASVRSLRLAPFSVNAFPWAGRSGCWERGGGGGGCQDAHRAGATHGPARAEGLATGKRALRGGKRGTDSSARPAGGGQVAGGRGGKRKVGLSLTGLGPRSFLIQEELG